jgi:hypothetical protein
VNIHMPFVVAAVTALLAMVVVAVQRRHLQHRAAELLAEESAPVDALIDELAGQRA